MGISYYRCISCGSSFTDCDDSVFYCTCGQKFCSPECGKCESNEKDEETCAYCRKESFTDKDLLNFLLRHTGLSREQVVELARNQK